MSRTGVRDRLFVIGDLAGIQVPVVKTASVRGIPVDTLKLHKLKGNMKDFWSITIEKPWCIIFQYQQGEFVNVEIKDYHD